MRRFTVLAFAVLVAATPAVFAAPAADTAAAEEGPVVVHWVGARFVTAGAKIYPQPDSRIIQEFNKALNIDLRAVKVDAFSAEEMNLLFATGEIPDHMLANQNNMLRYKDEGLLREIPLDMVKQHAPTYWRDYANGSVEGIWFDFPSWDKDTETLWALPNGGLEIKHQIVVRSDWLEAVGASVPTTVEEFAEGAPVHLRRPRRRRREEYLGHRHLGELPGELDQQPANLPGGVRLRAHRPALP